MGFYSGSSNPTHSAEKVLFWFHAGLFIAGFSMLFVKKLLNKT